MSKRHSTSRRRAYGRRQHELHERMDRRPDRRLERTWRTTSDSLLEPLPYLDAQGHEPPYGFAD